MWHRALIAAVVALTLSVAGCGGIKSGPVEYKEVEPPVHQFMVFYVPVSCGTNCTTNIPIMYWIDDDEDYVLRLRNNDGETGKVYVDRATFDRIKPGDVWNPPSKKDYSQDPTFAKSEHRPDH